MDTERGGAVQSCLTLCDPRLLCDGIPQARILVWVAISFSRGSPNPGIEAASLMSPALAGRFFTTCTTLEAHTLLQHAVFQKGHRSVTLETPDPVAELPDTSCSYSEPLMKEKKKKPDLLEDVKLLSIPKGGAQLSRC